MDALTGSFYSLFRNDVNLVITEKNNSIAFLTDNNHTQIDGTSFNFALIHAKTTRLNEFEYDDNIDIDIVDD